MTPADGPRPFFEKRKDIRHRCQKMAEVFVGPHRYPGCIRDESKGGIFVEARGSFLTGDDVIVVYESPTGIDFKRTGKIVNIDSNGIGVKFNYPGYNL